MTQREPGKPTFAAGRLSTQAGVAERWQQLFTPIHSPPERRRFMIRRDEARGGTPAACVSAERPP
jgi:hypothetical protein